MISIESAVNEFWELRNTEDLAKITKAKCIIDQVMDLLDLGEISVTSFENGQWVINDWVRKAVVLYFKTSNCKVCSVQNQGNWFDKVPLKFDGWTEENFKKSKIRTVPGSIVRKSAYIAQNVVLMPSFVNVAAYIDSGTMVDTWATVGSCAQIGKNVHLSGGVGIGGVLEPLQASPVIIEDGCFIGSRCIVVEGVHLEKEVVLGANVVLTKSTKIIDVSGSTPVEYQGRVPARSVVIPGSYRKSFPAGDYQVSCALIIGQRKPSTDLKTSLNDALRDFNLSV